MVGSSKASGKDKGKVVGRVICIQIPASLPMKPTLKIFTTSSALNIKLNLWKVQSNKGLNIVNGVSGWMTDKKLVLMKKSKNGKV